MKAKVIFIIFSVSLIIGSLMMMTSCDPPSLQITYPVKNINTSQDYEINSQNKYKITVKFNREVDVSTVIVGKTFKLITELANNADGNITWSNGNKTLVFISVLEVTQLNDFDPDAFFSIKLIGSDVGDGAIKDTDGIHLDGDGDGNDGGDYKFDFTTIG